MSDMTKGETYHQYTDAQVAEARRLNRMVEEEWRERLAEGKPCSGQAEWCWRRDLGRGLTHAG